MQPEIYLDNSSTTKPCQTAITNIDKALIENWGNPSSLHRLGFDAETIISQTKEAVADLLGCSDSEIFFTGSGTEANNLCIRGAAESLKRRGNKIITTSVEHPSVLNTCKYLEQNGFEVIFVKPEADGKIDAEKIINEIDSKTILVSIMLVNNETGCIFPVKKIAQALKEKNSFAIMHSDCVQAFGKLNIDVLDLGVDLLSASAHKIHGPKGLGFVYKSKKVNLKPIIYGGNQEGGLRSGTEPVPLIAGLLGAIKELDINGSYQKITDINRYAKTVLSEKCEAIINSPNDDYLPYIINISVPGYRSETLLHFLEDKNIFISSGSACSKGKGSHVLNEMGLSKELVDSALRISLSRYNEAKDIDALVLALTDAKASLCKKKRV